MNEANRRIASIDGIDEPNQRIEPQNDPKQPPKTTPNDHSGGSWALLGGSWGGLGPLLGALGPSWDGLGAILRASDFLIENQMENCQTPFAFWVDFGSQNGSQNDPKTIQKE